MTVAEYLLIAGLMAWSLYRQLQVQRLDPGSLLRLPIIFGVIGVAISGTQLESLFGPSVILYTLISIALSAVAGACRGLEIRVWQQGTTWFSKGTWVTVGIWLLMIAMKVGLGFYQGYHGGATGGPSVGEIFLFLALSFIVQNLVVAARSVWRTPSPAMNTSSPVAGLPPPADYTVPSPPPDPSPETDRQAPKAGVHHRP